MAQLDRLQYGARQTVASARHQLPLEQLTRIGFAAKGAVYSLTGILAFKLETGNGGETTDSKGVISRIAGQPFGEVAVAVIAVGLLAYAAWRFVCAFGDSDKDGSGAKGLAKRAGYFFSALFHASAGIFAFRLLTGNGGGGGNAQGWIARVMDAPGGEFLLVLAGLGIVAHGALQ